MLLHLHANLEKPLVIKATRLLVTYEDGTPMALLISYGPRHVRVCTSTDNDFHQQLRLHHINDTVLVNTLNMRSGSPNIFRGELK